MSEAMTIRAAGTVQALPEQTATVVATERHARAIARVPEDRRDRAIAEHCKVSNHMVATCRKKTESNWEISQLTKRKGKDGKERKPPKESRS